MGSDSNGGHDDQDPVTGLPKDIQPVDKFIVFGSPTISEDEVTAVEAVLRSGWLGRGPYVERFERAFAEYKNARYAVAVSSCTAALHLSLLAAGIESGDEVITTPLTFCATVNSIIHAGAVPVLVDVDPCTMNVDDRLIEKAITKRTRAIVPVHFAGRPCEMDGIRRLAAAYNLAVIEDCAHAIESQYRGTSCGTLGDFGCFSFYVTKNITTAEGGMILARTAEHAEKLRRLSHHGLSADAWQRHKPSGWWDYDVTEIGFKYNMTDIQAALGLKQLAKLDLYWARRRALWQEYDRRLRDLPVILPNQPPEHVRHAYHLYTILIDPQRAGLDRDEFVRSITQAGVGVGVHYRSVAEYDLYRRRFGWNPSAYPNAWRIGRQTVSLPLSAKITENEIERVVRAVAAACSPRTPSNAA